MHKSNYIVFDCETGGLYKDEHPITQFACQILDFKTLKEIDRWETFVRPYEGLKITKAALDKTMVNISEINTGITIKEFNKTFSTFLQQHNSVSKNSLKGRLIPVGHNLSFDNGFLEYAFNLDKLDFYDFVYEDGFDTMKFAHAVWNLTGEEKINLGKCCEYAGIKITDAHGAANDVEATCELLRYFIKKMRSKKGDVSTSETKQRKTGAEFFEFKCANK